MAKPTTAYLKHSVSVYETGAFAPTTVWDGEVVEEVEFGVHIVYRHQGKGPWDSDKPDIRLFIPWGNITGVVLAEEPVDEQ